MSTNFYKPDMKFTFYQHGLLSMYLQDDYDKVRSYSDLLNFFHKWTNDMEKTDNVWRRSILEKVVIPLYQMITGRSYETKQFETIID